MNTAIWLIRREFWENRAIWMIPAVISAVLILAALFGKVDLNDLPSPEHAKALGGMFLFSFGMTFFVVMSIYSTWYLLDCLYADRKDRSILFWKSLPVSDTATVLTKLATALIVIPLVYFAAADLTTLTMAFIVSVRLRSSIGSALWQADLWLQLQALWVYLIITTAIWYLPIAGWLLVVSAWAKRAVMLWSILPPIALFLAERWFLGTHVIAEQLVDRLAGFGAKAFHGGDGALMAAAGDHGNNAAESVWRFLNIDGFFLSTETWVGALVGVALIACAIQLRMRRTET